ncbi:Alpha/beta hydrolase fold protein [Hyella patelloides LEGE 07179]|uniref:Alpha/beta hydrolase fold protein n=1 Tax=Hyella patelloides LEGE 07179 TaxID=945734 RepID=A0A563VLE4_9CYAN|nr:alpha/beta hydrolase [Hyella patelloides]VEP12259.1 Alpha/beta hydrolase fold protein [Hyella patelloides LEGE 07179]
MKTRCTFQSSNITLSYLQWNRGKEPLLLLHGMADLNLVWSSLGEFLAEKYHIVAPDLRGHGESSKPKTGYCCQDIINDLEALMDELGWENAHILGHSWGGKIAALWANNHPQRFRSLILVDPFYVGKLPSWLKITFPLLYRVLPFLQGMKPYPSYEAAEAAAKELKQYQGWSDLQQKVFQASIEKKADGTWRSKFPVAARDGIFDDVMTVASFTKQVDVPTLLIKLDAGLNRSQWQFKPYYQYLSHLEVREISGNHWAFLTNPEIFNQTIQNYLTSVRPKTI